MCTRFAERILGDLLGYSGGDWIINPSAGEDDATSGIPDIQVDAREGEQTVRWIVGEAKLDDEKIRNKNKREGLWSDKRKYVSAETVYFIWVAQRTVIVCDPTGKVLVEVYFDEDRLISEIDRVVCTVEDARVAEELDLVSASQARGFTFLEKFREGKLAARHIEVSDDTVDKLADTLSGVIISLRAYLARRWNVLTDQYSTFQDASDELKEQFDSLKDLIPEQDKELRRQRLHQRYQAAIELHEYAFPEFQKQQAYTDWEPYEEGQGEREDLETIFRTNAAYVILGRLLFVRLAEDRTDKDGKPLISRKISNGGLKLWRQLMGAEEPHIGKLVDLAFTQAGSVFQQLFAPTPFDKLISLDDIDFDRVLLVVLYRLNAFDFRGLNRDALGDLYQKLLPRELRKKIGEFYTDIEVVEYILHRTGFVEAARTGAPKLLDPACGSGTFLVRAAHYLIEGAQERGVSAEQTLQLVQSCIHGLDINDFAVFIARVNLLFVVFDLIAETRRDVSFQLHEANSLTRPAPIQFTTEHGQRRPALIESTPGEQVRDGRYDFVVGNPPYVRAERIPDADRDVIQRTYPGISQRNVDLAAYFAYRGIDWLAEGGTFGMILPRAIADAGFAQSLRTELDKATITVSEITPLDWACHELFDSDVVPFILKYQRTSKEESAVVRLVHGLRRKSQLVQERAAKDGPVATEIEWRRFVTAGQGAVWPLESTHRDMDVENTLRLYPRFLPIVKTRYGAALRTDCPVAETQKEGYCPLLTGSNVYAYYTTEPHRFAQVERASDASLWSDTRWISEDARFVPLDINRPIPNVIVASAIIGITVNAAVIDPAAVAVQNTVSLSVWTDVGSPPAALAGLLNSSLIRWYAFIFLRAGVAGGGRRDHHTYPGTIDALPLPRRETSTWIDAIGDPVAEIAEVARESATLDPEAWAATLEQYPPGATLSAWPIRWQTWPERFSLHQGVLCAERLRDDCLQLTKSITITSDNSAALDFLEMHLPILAEQGQRLSRQEAQGLPVPAPKTAARVMEQYQKAVAARDRARKKYLNLVEEVDEAVFSAYDLPSKLVKVIRRRMTEFPLSEYAARYRKPWEPTRRPKIKIFEPGERYH